MCPLLLSILDTDFFSVCILTWNAYSKSSKTNHSSPTMRYHKFGDREWLPKCPLTAGWGPRGKQSLTGGWRAWGAAKRLSRGGNDAEERSGESANVHGRMNYRRMKHSHIKTSRQQVEHVALSQRLSALRITLMNHFWGVGGRGCGGWLTSLLCVVPEGF